MRAQRKNLRQHDRGIGIRRKTDRKMDSKKIATTNGGGAGGFGENEARVVEIESGGADDEEVDVVGFPIENPFRSRIEIETEMNGRFQTESNAKPETETESDSKNSGSDSSACDGAWENEMDSSSSDKCDAMNQSRLRLNGYFAQNGSCSHLDISSRTMSEEAGSDCCSRNIACTPSQCVVDKFRFTIAHLLGF